MTTKIKRPSIESLIEALSDFDDEIAAKYLEGDDLSEDEIKVGIRKATLS